MKQICFILCFIELFFSHCDRDYKATHDISVLPSFDMLLLDSITHLNAKQIPDGKPIVMMYFRPDCPHCRAETKSLVGNIELLKGIHIYFISGSTIDDIKTFNAQYHLTQYSNITIGKDYEHSFLNIFDPGSIPYMAIYDSNKKLVKIYKGEVSITSLLTATHI